MDTTTDKLQKEEIVKEKKVHNRCFLTIFLIPIGVILILLSRISPEITEYYSHYVYPLFMNTILFLTNYIPFSLIEVVLLTVPAVYIIYCASKIYYSEKDKRKQLWKKYLSWLTAWISVLFFALVMFEGINYNRKSVSELIGLETEKSTKYELSAMCSDLADKANHLRYSLTEDNMGASKLFSDDIYKVSDESYKAFEKLAVKYPFLQGNKVKAKPLLCSKLMSYTEITGIFSPLTMEANINADVTAYSIPATICHEISHVRGIAREDEANFISYLACMESSDKSIRYSGVMLALVHSMNQLYVEDYDMFLEIYLDYSEGVKSDLDAYSNYWKHFEGPVADITNKVNDTYLKMNNQQDGVKSYGKMVDLLLANWRKTRYM